MNMSYASPLPRRNFSVKDPYSALTHFIGILAAGLLTPPLLLFAERHQSAPLKLPALSVFMISTILLYSASTIYHTFELKGRAGQVLKKVDHCMIFVLIAGSYTPFCLLPLRDQGGMKLLLFVWGFALAGTVFKLFWVNCPKWVSSVIYIGMGWSCLFSIPTMLRTLSPLGFGLVLTGGLIYTAGGVLYALKLKAFNSRNPDFGSHEIFHLFILAGNFCHYLCMWTL